MQRLLQALNPNPAVNQPPPIPFFGQPGMNNLNIPGVGSTGSNSAGFPSSLNVPGLGSVANTSDNYMQQKQTNPSIHFEVNVTVEGQDEGQVRNGIVHGIPLFQNTGKMRIAANGKHVHVLSLPALNHRLSTFVERKTSGKETDSSVIQSDWGMIGYNHVYTPPDTASSLCLAMTGSGFVRVKNIWLSCEDAPVRVGTYLFLKLTRKKWQSPVHTVAQADSLNKNDRRYNRLLSQALLGETGVLSRGVKRRFEPSSTSVQQGGGGRGAISRSGTNEGEGEEDEEEGEDYEAELKEGEFYWRYEPMTSLSRYPPVESMFPLYDDVISTCIYIGVVVNIHGPLKQVHGYLYKETIDKAIYPDKNNGDYKAALELLPDLDICFRSNKKPS
jgi:hypothetical protein